MSDYRESSNAAKAVRRGIVQSRPVGGKKRQAKDVIVESRYRADAPGIFGLLFGADREWRKHAAYNSPAVAQQAIANLERKYRWSEYRIKP
jgi:hypothetical protein